VVAILVFVESKSSPEQRRMALEMYLEGMGFRAIGRVLNVSYGTVYQWVKKWENLFLLPKSENPIEIIELDEIHSYIQNKKTSAGRGLLLIDLENASSIFFVQKEAQQHLGGSGIV